MRSLAMSGCPFITSATSLTTLADTSRSPSLPPWLTKPSFSSTSIFPSASRTHSGPGSGQPSSSLMPFSVFGLVGAVVEAVRDAVGVVVRVGAAVGVLEAVLVLGLVGALVDLVGDPVAVAVLGGRRAA